MTKNHNEAEDDEEWTRFTTPEKENYATINSSSATSNGIEGNGHHHRRKSSEGAPLTPGKITHYVPSPTARAGDCTSSTTHNDPSLRDLLQNTPLRGSTRMLQAYYQESQSPAPQNEGVHRRWAPPVFPGQEDFALPFTEEQDTSEAGEADCHEFPRLPQLGSENADSSRLRLLRESSRRYSLTQSVRGVIQHVNKGFFQDARSLAEGTIPQSVVLSLVIGIVCGIAAYLYYSCLFFLLGYIWTTVPEQYLVPTWDEKYYWLYIPLVSFTLATLVGLTIVVLGDAGDLPFCISCIHTTAYIPMNHVVPMFFASLFSILAGGSLGPEAPLVAICGALGGFVSRGLFRQTNIHVIRKHSLMGMAGALSAFFGCPLGGSLFALEVNSRFGVEYFEHMVEAIFAGEITLVVFRSLSGLPIAPIWDLTMENNQHMEETTPGMVVAGASIGLLGAAAAYVFASFHWLQMSLFDRLGLLDNSKAVYRATLACIVIASLGVLIPHTMFWGEEEFQVIARMSPAKELPFVWPQSGLIGFEIDGPFKAFIVGCAKIVAISYTVTGGFRGGYIFPLFSAGAAFGQALHCLCPFLSLPVAILCFSAGMNVAITRTALASTIILTFLGGELFAMPAVLAASLCSLFATAYVPFIKTQIARSDLDHSLYHKKSIVAE